MMNRIASILVLLLLTVAAGTSAQNGVATQGAPSNSRKPKADLIFIHGNIYTGEVAPVASLGANQRAQALAVGGDRILGVGTRDEIMKFKGPDTKDGRWLTASPCCRCSE